MKCYLDKNQIERLASDAGVYKRGVQYYAGGRVAGVDFFEEEGNGIVTATVYGSYSDYKVNAAFDKAGLLKKYSCTCDAFGVWRGACKHIIATLLHVFELNRQNAVISRNLRESKSLLGIFEKLAYDEIESSFGPREEQINAVALEPTFCSSVYGECFLTFKIGRNRKYVIKSVEEFIFNFRSEKVVSYGKELEFRHKLCFFDEQSAKLAKLILDEYGRFESVTRALSNPLYLRSGFSARNMPLTPQCLDRLFGLYEGRELDCDFFDGRQRRIVFSSEKLPLRFELKRGGGGAALKPLGKAASIFDGEHGSYILFGDALYYADAALSGVIEPIFRTLRVTRDEAVLFSEKDMAKLSAFLIPRLREFDLLDETDEIKSVFGSAELKKKVYLDAEGKDVLCRVLLDYGGTEFELNDKPEIDGARDVIQEYRFKALLSKMGFVFSAKNGQFTLTGDGAVYEFYYSESGLAKLRQSAEVFATEAFDRVSERRKTSAKAGVRINGGLLEISVDTAGFSKDELMDVLQSYRVKKKFHRLKDGAFIDFSDVEENGLGALEELLGELSLGEKDMRGGLALVPKFRAVSAGGIIQENSTVVETDDGFRRLVSDFKNYADLEFAIPETLEDVLRGYQREGFKWLMVLAYYGFGGVLADDMGLGKTLQVIAVLLAYKQSGGEASPSIVVAPTSLIYNWEKEIQKFAPELCTHIVAGAAGKRRELFETSQNIDVYITTYDTLKRDMANYAGMNFRYVVADEAQSIKNPSTQNAKAVKALQGQTKFALTGTPIENSLSELWSIFDFIMPDYLYSAAKFQKNYETPIVKNESGEAANRLRRQIAPFILRRLKRDVLTELPQKIETTLYAEMPPEQKKLYTAYLLKAKGELNETIKGGEYNKSQIEILSKLTRLRQICCHPAVFAEGYKGGSGKLDLTLESVGSYLESGHRILIFSQFTKMLDIIRTSFDKSGISYFYLDGATPSKDRLAMADSFNAGERQAFLISLKAGGTGLNLTGADVVIHYDPWWNPAVMEQASDRAHRIGQDKTVQVINIVAKDSIEEKIMLLQAKKKDLFDTVIEEGANFINKMSEEDIVELFN